MAHLAHYREAHPLPFVITHWINLVAMILLIVTGFAIDVYKRQSPPFCTPTASWCWTRAGWPAWEPMTN